MKIQFFCPLWGSELLPFRDFCYKVKTAGYDGVEMGLPLDPRKKQKVLDELNAHELLLIGQHYETQVSDFEEHVREYAVHLKNLVESKPLLINSQTGKDYYSFDQNQRLIDLARAISHDTGVDVVHETHRSKFSFAAHVAKDYLQKIPDLRICLDISHWCNVAESYLHDQSDAVDLALERTDHIHARVGYPEGPQIPDPQDDAWSEALEFHTQWWEKVIAIKESQHKASMTITTEFGPEPYMVILPFSHKPVASQWETNLYMMRYLKNRFSKNDQNL